MYLLTYLSVGKKRILTFGSQILLESSLLSLSTGLWSLLQQTVNLEHKSGWYWLPLRVKVLVWLAVANRVSRVYNLRRGIILESISDICSSCGKERDGHLFLHYGVSSNLWGWLLRRFGLFWCMPFLLCMAIKGWRAAPFKWCKLLLQKSAPLVVQWSIRRGR